MNICSKVMAAGLLTSAIGLTTLVGWLLDIDAFKRIHSDFPLMFPDAALAFVLSGLSLSGIHAGHPKLAQAGAYIVLLLGVLPVVVDATDGGLYVSLWRLVGGQAGGADVGGHMSAMSSAAFVLAGLGLASVGKGRARPPAQLAALGVLSIAAFVLIGYAYNVPWIHAFARTMAVHSAFAAAVLGLGLLFTEPGRGFAAVISSELSGGILLRRLLPYIIAVPVVVGWLRLHGEYAGLYGMNTGLALFTLSNITILTVLLYRSAQLLNRKDLALHESEQRAREILNNTLDGIVTANELGIIENFNAAASKMFGYTSKEIIGKNVTLLMPEPHRSNHDRYIADYLRSGVGRLMKGHRRELTAMRRDGELFPVELALTEVWSGQRRYFIALIYDISGRVRTRMALEASEKRLRAIFDAEPECVKLMNADGTLLDINPAGLSMLEADSVEQAKSHGCAALIAPHDRATFRAFLKSALRGGTASLQFEITGFKGTHRWLDAVATALPTDDAESRTLLVVARDVTQRQLAEQALRISEARYRRVFEADMLGIGYWDAHGGILGANDKLLDIIGYTREEMQAGKPNWLAMTPPEHLQADRDALKSIRETGVCVPFEKEYIRKDGHRVQVLIGGAAFEDSKDSGVFFVMDISARKLAEIQLRKLSLAVEHSPAAIVITDFNAIIEYVNPKFYQLTGYTSEEVLGRTPKILQSGLTPVETYQDLWETILAGEEWHGEFHDRKKNGQIYWCLQSISPVKNECGDITHFVSVTEDISERKHSESVIRHLAFYDPLTNLPNRTLFRDRLEQAAALAQRNERLFAVMYLDLDRFKNVNDTLGHPVGDLLLKAVAERMRQGLRDTDTIARLGGDEFAVIVQDMSCPEDALRLAEHLLQAFATPFFIEDHELFTTPSIGISIYPQDTADIDTLIKVADIALYRAKELGRNNCQFFTADMNVTALEHLFIENQLQHVLERQELVLHYQPQINLRSGAIRGVEALVRWRHPELGMVSPGAFIPIAEDSGLIVTIGEWVLREACKANKAWLDLGLPEMLVAVNVSAKQLRQKNFIDTVAAVLEETGLPPRLLEIELTESCVMQNPEQAIAVLEKLKIMGIKLAMDDFGTGYSSLAYLKRLPFDKIKIDRSFVIDMVTDTDAAAITHTIIAMAHGMRRVAIAEGVETAAQLDFLRSEGCDEIQGFYFSYPLEDAVLVRYVREQGWLALAGIPKNANA